jgi:membrane protease YdiL (CAAX protease family)
METERQSVDKRFVLVAAWVVVLLISDLPNVLWVNLSGDAPDWLWWGKTGVLGVALVICLLWKAIRPLWQFTLVFLIFYLAIAARDAVWGSDFWQGLFGGEGASFTASFTRSYLGFHTLDVAVALVVIAVLWLIKRRRSEFFLVKGDTSAPIEPVRWLGIGKGESWRVFGWIFTVCAGIGVSIPILLGVKITSEGLQRLLPLIPVVLLLAAVNAFAEEIYYRASMLSTLKDLLGNNQTLLLSVVFFGMAHYLYGSPAGIPGFLLTGFLAFLLGKSMLETKGLLWPWFMHLVPDVVVFASYVLASG